MNSLIRNVSPSYADFADPVRLELIPLLSRFIGLPLSILIKGLTLRFGVPRGFEITRNEITALKIDS